MLAHGGLGILRNPERFSARAVLAVGWLEHLLRPRGEDRLYRVSYKERMLLWVSEEERELQARLMLCAHMQDAGHRGVRATTYRLGAYCAWDNIEKDIAKTICQCLHCIDSKVGNAMLRPLGNLVHGTKVGDVLHFDYLRLVERDESIRMVWSTEAISMCYD